MAEYSLADLTRITGAKRRSVQLWAEAGVIKALPGTERAGTGTHRRFSRDEAIVGCIVHAFARQQISIGQLLSVADATRHFLSAGLYRWEIEKAITDEIYQILILTTWEDRGGGYSADLIRAPFAELGHEIVIKGSLDDLRHPYAFAGIILLNFWLAGLR